MGRARGAAGVYCTTTSARRWKTSAADPATTVCIRWRSKSRSRLEIASTNNDNAGVSQREFLPAAGRDVFLPLYDPLVSLMGFGRAVEELISQASVESHHEVLDVGCGTGTVIVMLKRAFPAVQIVGLDPDSKALQRARAKTRRAGVAVQLDQGFADELPYREGSFDRVFSSFMFHHLEEHEREKTSREILRVLKPGGSFHLLDFVTDPAMDGFFVRLIGSHALMRTNTNERIFKLMSRAGFTNVTKVKEGSMLFGLMRTSYFRATA
jgi:ubiquinone/menaquinone biosynthesis C-methylase UbiE